jgi:superfamily II DNA or RNA helicase
MFSTLRRLIGLISVTEVGDQIKIAGLPGEVVRRDIVEMWATNKISENMFSHVSDSDVSFNRWFAPDVVYVLQKLIAEGSRRNHIRALNKVVELMYERTWLKDTLTEHPASLDWSKVSMFKYGPLEHQDRFLRTYDWAKPRYRLKGYLLAAGPGTGKTFMGLLMAEMLHAGIIIIVCPKNAVKRVWANSINGEVQDRLYKKEGIPVWTSLDGTKPDRRTRHFVVHFDALEKFLAEVPHLSIRKPVLLLDESHNLNDDTSVRAEEFIKLCQLTRSEDILWESGTPVKAVGGEMATLMQSIDGMFDHDAQQRFKAIYGKSSAKANDILAARMGRMTFKVSSKSVVKAQGHAHERLITIPNAKEYTLDALREEMRAFVKSRAEYYLKNMKHFERQYEEILKHFEKTLVTKEQKTGFETYKTYIRMIRRNYDPSVLKEQAIYCNKYEKDVIGPTLPRQAKEAFKNVRSIIKYYKLKVQGEALGQILGKRRAQCIADMVPHIDMAQYIDSAKKKTIIFTSYVTVVDVVSDYLKKGGYKPAIVYGETSNQLASIVGAFERDPDLNPLIATYASLSTAVPLVMANEMILLNQPFRSYERDQATARCVRQGQDEDVNIQDIFLDTGEEPNISTRSRDILMWSRQQVEEILDFKNPTFAMESISQITQLPEQDWIVAMEEFLEDTDGFQGIEKWGKEPSWVNGW